MSAPIISGYGIDADGFVYSEIYEELLSKIINEFGNFFYSEQNYKSLDPKEREKIKQKILASIASFEPKKINQKKGMNVTNKTLNAKIHSLKAQYEYSAKMFDSEIPDEMSHLKNPLKSAQHDVLHACIKGMNQFDPDIMGKIFLHANKPLLEHLKTSFQTMNASLYLISFFTNRQSFAVDKNAQYEQITGSIYQDMQYLLAELKKIMPDKKIAIQPIIAADVYGHLDPGISFQKINDELFVQSDLPIHSDHAHYINDETKLSLIYMLTHSAASDAAATTRELQKTNSTSDLEEATIYYHFYDDKEHIQRTLRDKLTMHANALPKNTKITLFVSDGRSIQEPYTGISGKGEVDDDYAANMRQMAETCRQYLKEPSAMKIDVATQMDLLTFLQERKNHKKQSMMQPTIRSLENLSLSPRPLPRLSPQHDQSTQTFFHLPRKKKIITLSERKRKSRSI